METIQIQEEGELVAREAPWIVTYEDWLQVGSEPGSTSIRRANAALWALASGAGIVALCYFISSSAALLSIVLVLLLVPLIARFITSLVLLCEKDKWGDTRDMYEAAIYEERWMVQIRLIEAGLVTGTDMGALWLEDGRLYFSGRRMSFAITPDDVARSSWLFHFLHPCSNAVYHEIDIPLEERGRVGQRSISISYSKRCPGYTTGDHVFLRQAILGFKRRRRTGVRGQLPPSSRGPGSFTLGQMLVDGTLDTVAKAFVGFVVAGVSCILFGYPPEWVTYGALVVAVSAASKWVLAAFTMVRFRLKDRRRRS